MAFLPKLQKKRITHTKQDWSESGGCTKQLLGRVLNSRQLHPLLAFSKIANWFKIFRGPIQTWAAIIACYCKSAENITPCLFNKLQNSCPGAEDMAPHLCDVISSICRGAQWLMHTSCFGIDLILDLGMDKVHGTSCQIQALLSFIVQETNLSKTQLWKIQSLAQAMNTTYQSPFLKFGNC